MKRLSRKQKDRLTRLAKRAERRKRQRERRRKALIWRPIGYRNLRAPEMMSLTRATPRGELIKFLASLREAIVQDRVPTLIDFTRTSKLEAGATLIFVAELRRSLQLVSNTVRVRCVPPRSVKVAQVFKHIEIFSLLGYRKKIDVSFDDVIHWKYASGHDVEGEKYENILGAYDGKVTEALSDSLYRGLTEAMTNCHHHAYIDVRPDGLNANVEQKTWWMFSQERNGVLSVAFCDLGVGIPATIPVRKPSVWERLISLGQSNSDAHIIEQAVESSISRTGKSYRGKGLKQLLEAVQAAQTDGAGLRIISNRGCYTFNNGKASVVDLDENIMGTLISWTLPLSKRTA